ncbi:uncharacterized protein BDW43DRAFT_306801 [Aspergillus alliaceus]|uniref:uncharacterized protein n=1 Tax=Petromyces alliaceus TaxID=209559 RepID=UPI0012A4FC69|nr:uncharacterized protein BDW43DRAFT_306801 [Aspergillus alliaceus]KAB8238105.1 hypothetical protein BDW43DRAFT_306801 [Aspergillus alliaceus]
MVGNRLSSFRLKIPLGCRPPTGGRRWVVGTATDIDFPAPGKAVGVVEERELIITSFNDLLKQQSTLLTKVLLTASFASDVESTRMSLDALLIRSLISAVRRQPQRQLSVAATIEDEPGPVLHRLVEIQERICRAIQFTLLPMLYPADSPIYTCVYGVLRANWTSELSGMDPRLLGAYSPFIIRAWAIDLNGKLDVLKIHGTWLNPRAIYGELFVPDRKRETLISIFSPYQDVRYKPPDATLVLLHGGPGLSKATSARVVAEVLEYPPLSVASADIAKQESESVARLTTILDSGTGEY